MKNIFWIVLLLYLTSCINQSDNQKKEEQKKDKKVSSRDRSINHSNSYSDLFLDSMAMEKYISQKKLPDSIANRTRSFYNTRNYQYAWFSSNGLTEQARGFWNLHDYVTTYDDDSLLKDKKLQKEMDELISEDSLSVNANSKKFINTELALTQHFIQYILNNYEKGYIKRKEMERFIPRKKEYPLYLADSLLSKKHKDDRYFEDVNASYKALKDELEKYYTIAKSGGWPKIDPSKKVLKKGMKSAAIVKIKKRLQLTGDMPGNDSTKIFDDSLKLAVKNFQSRYGYTPDGVITEHLINEMNVPAMKRVEQILMNMNRMRWLASEPKGNLIVVNIPEFELHVYKSNQKLFDMDVVVGKEGHSTMMFNGNLNQVVFSPYWNIPESIVKNEVLPEMEKDDNYLDKENMEITGNENGLPVIRQKPGDKNALGRVKFLFPNNFNIYLHDTPAKSLFESDKRAYSHGCIRVKEPEKLAEYVLRNQPDWTPEKIEKAMNSGDEQFVRVKNPIPVIITYYTAWVDESGKLNFRDDIYGHDRDLAEKMFYN